MRFIKVKTRVFVPPRDNIYNLLEHIRTLKDGDIVVITSKVLSVHQGRCIKIGPSVDKRSLIKREAEKYIETDHIQKHHFILTIKNYTLIPSAGIDESNGNGYYILWPKKLNGLLRKIHEYLRRKHKIRKLGLIATDSHTVPMRSGVLGISIGFYGFEPIYDYTNKRDIFGRKFKYTKVNIVDALSAICVLLMGEGNERTPIIVIRGANVTFTQKNTYRKLIYSPRQDLYYPLLKVFDKKAKSAMI